MTTIALQTAIERARATALAGDAAAFAELRRGIATLDRDGEAPVRELHMLGVVAAARLADLPGVDQGLADLQPIAAREWSTLRAWLLGAPELSLPAYAEFVQSLDRRMRQTVKVPPSRRWTPALAIVLAGALLSLLLLGWRLTPAAPERASRDAIVAMLQGDAAAVTAALPGTWGNDLHEAARLLAAHRDPALLDATHAALALLATTLEGAANAPNATRLAERLMGPHADASHLKRLASGVRSIDASPWVDPSKWEKEAWAWRPTDDALFAHRTLLRHLPLGVWFGGWFSASWRCDPLGTQDVSVNATADDATQATIVVQIGMDSWPATLARRERSWVPRTLLEHWGAWQPQLAPERCTADRTHALQQAIVTAARTLEEWVRTAATDADAPLPPALQLPWWVP